MTRTPTNLIWMITLISGLLWVLIGAMTGHEPLGMPYASYMEKAQRYHIVHTLVCMMISTLVINKRRLIGVIAFMLGILFFSGSLYLMAVYHWPLNVLVPVGGVSFLLGWTILLYDAFKSAQ